MKLVKKCTHANPAVVCQYKNYAYINGKAIRECHNKGGCFTEGRKKCFTPS
jgi:hypothetical protein